MRRSEPSRIFRISWDGRNSFWQYASHEGLPSGVVIVKLSHTPAISNVSDQGIRGDMVPSGSPGILLTRDSNIPECGQLGGNEWRHLAPTVFQRLGRYKLGQTGRVDTIDPIPNRWKAAGQHMEDVESRADYA